MRGIFNLSRRIVYIFVGCIAFDGTDKSSRETAFRNACSGSSLGMEKGNKISFLFSRKNTIGELQSDSKTNEFFNKQMSHEDTPSNHMEQFHSSCRVPVNLCLENSAASADPRGNDVGEKPFAR
eukprot:scaffold4600_cov169-Amphora_coffeaeformis.AAC.1